MDEQDLKKWVKIYYNTATAYRSGYLSLVADCDNLLNAQNSDYTTDLVKRAHYSLPSNNLNARARPAMNNILPETMARKYGEALTRFRGAYGDYLVRNASAGTGNPNEYFIHNVAGDTEMADNLDEVVSDIRRDDNVYDKFTDLAGDIYVDNSGLLSFDRYGVFGNELNAKTKVIKGRNILYDPESSPHDIQTSRFVAFDGMTHSYDTLSRLLQRNDNTINAGNVNTVMKRFLTKPTDNDEMTVDFGTMYLYDTEDKKVHFVEFDTQDFIIIRHDVRDPVSIGTRDIKFRLVGGVSQKRKNNHYSPSEFHSTIPFINAKTQGLIDILTAVNRAKDNTQLVSPQAFQTMLNGVLSGMPVIEFKGASASQPLANQVTSVPQIDIGALQAGYAQIEQEIQRTFPASSREIAGTATNDLKSVYQGNLEHLKRLLDNESPIRMAERDYIQVVISIIAENRNHEFLVRSTGVSGFGVKRFLGSRLLRMDDETSSTAVDIRPKRAGENNLIMKKEFISGIAAFAQTAFNPANIADYVARNADKEMIRLTPDDLYVLKSPYPAYTVRRVLSDIKNVAFGEDIEYPTPMTTPYVKTLQECIEMKKADLSNPDGSLTLEGERVIAFMDYIVALFELEAEQNSPSFQEAETEAVEQETMGRQRATTQPDSNALNSLFANQVTDANAVAG